MVMAHFRRPFQTGCWLDGRILISDNFQHDQSPFLKHNDACLGEDYVGRVKENQSVEIRDQYRDGLVSRDFPFFE